MQLTKITQPLCFAIRTLFLCLVIVAPESIAAEANDAPAENALIQSYREYSNARYAARWTVDPAQLHELLQITPRYRYLILYSNEQLLNQNQATVQFGFFQSKQEADKFVADNSTAFKGLHAVPVSAAQHTELFDDNSSGVYWLAPETDLHQNDIENLFRKAKDAYIAKDYQRSLKYYSVLALSADRDSQAWAQELVGVNYERLGDLENAQASYRALLEKYPEGLWVSRVQQRLRALETAADDGKSSLRTPKYAEQAKDYYWRGIIGQTFNQVSQSGDNIPSRDALSVISTNFDLTAGTTRWQGHELEARLSGYDLMDLQDSGDDAKTRIKRFYLSYTHDNSGLNVVGGRQRDSEAGVFGYYDGASVKYPVGDKWTVGAKAGVPVTFSDFYDSMDIQFASVYGIYQLNEQWQFSGYFNYQTLYGEIDRAAYGGKVLYSSAKVSSSLLLDYDYEFAEFNLIRWSGNYTINNKSRINANYGRQHSPSLAASNIKVGQPYLNVEDYLREQFNRDYLLYNAQQRTSIYEYGSLSYHRKLDEKLEVSLDVYQSVSSDVPVFESQDGWITTDVIYHGSYRYTSVGAQAVALSFLTKNDVATLSYRYGDTTFATMNTVNFSERFRIGDHFFLNPRIGFRQSTNKDSEDSETRVRASLALSYKPWRNTEFRLEGGNEVIEDLEAKNSIDNTFIYAGYQLRF